MILKIKFEWVQKYTCWYLKDPFLNSIAEVIYDFGHKTYRWKVYPESGFEASNWCNSSDSGMQCVEDALKEEGRWITGLSV